LRCKEEKGKWDHLSETLAEIRTMTPEEVLACTSALATSEGEKIEVSGKISQAEAAMAWLKAVDSLHQSLEEVRRDLSKAELVHEAFAPERQKLEQGARAARLDGVYAAMDSLRQAQSKDQVTLERVVEEEKALNLEAERAEGELLLQAKRVREAKLAQEAAMPEIRRVREIDLQSAALSNSALEVQRECERDEKLLSEGRRRLKEIEGLQVSAEAVFKEACAYLATNACDEVLVGELAGIEARLGHLGVKFGEVRKYETDVEGATRVLEKARRENEEVLDGVRLRQEMQDEAKHRVEAQQTALERVLGGKSLRDYREAKEAKLREKYELTLVAGFEEQRANLEEGKACPLCGALHHPFSGGNVPSSDAIDQEIAALSSLIESVEAGEKAWVKLSEAERKSAVDVALAEKGAVVATQALASAEARMKEAQERLALAREEASDYRLVAEAKLRPLGVEGVPEDGIKGSLASLRGRLEAWNSHIKGRDSAKEKLGTMGAEVGKIEAELGIIQSNLDGRRSVLEEKRSTLAEKLAERKALYGDKSPDEEEKALGCAVEGAEASEKKARDLSDVCRQKLNHVSGQVQTLQEKIATRLSELAESELAFGHALERSAFGDEAHYLSSKLSDGVMEALTLQGKALDDDLKRFQTMQGERERRLTEEAARALTDKTLDALGEEHKALYDRLKLVQAQIYDNKRCLDEDVKNRALQGEKLAAREAQEKAYRRWKDLSDLIGSSDGKIYRRFVQGLTFEILIGQANHQLMKMSDRYILFPSDKEALTIQVIDNYQGGEKRSTKNLSGGERFIVSMALALGLSQMASRKVRVDSLFLDEGFGTLDEDTLDVALNTLASLNQEGKLIGIISHVAALRERIGAQIRVVPLPGGRSRIEGPGCRQL
ncbi:MAG: hypothetical protein FWC40_06230, partial [Proteobacteria bacterium]|nr:hypothetical protein [Pseudomonadota bacterium]